MLKVAISVSVSVFVWIERRRFESPAPWCEPYKSSYLFFASPFLQDLARAFVLALGNPKAYGQVYNISGPKYVTFDGIAKACAEAMGKKAEIVHFNPKDFDFGKKKGFPLRDQVCRVDGRTDGCGFRMEQFQIESFWEMVSD